MSIALSGAAKVQVDLRSTDRMSPEDVLLFHPEIKAKLDEVTNQGWTYLYIETVATALAEVNVDNTRFRINPNAARNPLSHGLPENVLELDIGTQIPSIIGIPEVNEFRINVCSKSFPRAATVDLATGIISYLHDSFWKWQAGWETDEKKLSAGREVHEIATWLVDTKKYKLHDDLRTERYQELSQIFSSLPVQPVGEKK